MKIEVQNVCKSFKNVDAVQNVKLRVESGEAVALLGPNGAGKTTLVEMIEGNPETYLRYRFDPNNAEAHLTYLLLEGVFRKQKFVRQKAEVRPLTMIGSRYIDFLIPGLMAMSIMNACLWGIRWNLIELPIKKLLRRMVATPLRKSVFSPLAWTEPYDSQHC